MEQGFVPTIGPRLTAVDIEDIMCDLGVEIRDQGLVDAIRAGDADAVQRTGLELRSPLTSRSKEEAILLRRLDFLRLLLERDDYIDEHMVAESCRFRDHEAISTLLEFGWPINKSVRFAASMLSLAINDLGFTQWLVKKGADVNARNDLDESALTAAINHGDLAVVHFLLQEGTDIAHGNLLHYAASRKNQVEGAELVEYLAQRGADVNAYQHNNPVAFRWRCMGRLRTPLHLACENGNIPAIKALLRNSADIQRKLLEAGREGGYTPLERAIETGRQDIAHLLEGGSAKL